jgi:ubiquinone/menaquinone biosynthesis C-methylase UbiE
MIVRLTLLERILHRLHLLPAPIMDAFGSIIFGRVLTVAVRRGVFEVVASASRSVKEIAEATQLDARAVGLMAEALCAAGYLQREGTGYIASAEGKKWLVQSSPHYLGNLVRYFETLYSRWERFEYALEHGKPERPYFDLFTEEDWRVYVYGMRDLAKLLLPHVESRLVLHGTPESLLDLGGSHGLYAIELCRRYPTLRAVVADFAPALVHTRQIAAAEAMTERIAVLEGDFRHVPFPASLDAVLMFNLVHGFRDDENRSLITRAYAALKTGGKLFILDQMQDGRRRSQLATLIPLMVGLNMLNEIGGTVYAVEEVERWCSAFSSVRHHRLRLPGVVLIEAVK